MKKWLLPRLTSHFPVKPIAMIRFSSDFFQASKRIRFKKFAFNAGTRMSRSLPKFTLRLLEAQIGLAFPATFFKLKSST